MNEEAMLVSDPVCGRQIDIDEAAAQEEHDGWVYFFCSAQCHQLFRQCADVYAWPEQRRAASPAAGTKRKDHEQG